MHHAVVDSILDIGALVLLPGNSRWWLVSFSVNSSGASPSQYRDEFTEHRMRCRDRTRAGEVWTC